MITCNLFGIGADTIPFPLCCLHQCFVFPYNCFVSTGDRTALVSSRYKSGPSRTTFPSLRLTDFNQVPSHPIAFVRNRL